MAVNDSTGIALGNIPLSTTMLSRSGVSDYVESAASGIIESVSGLIDTAISTVWKAGGSVTASGQTSGVPTGLVYYSGAIWTAPLLVSGNEGKVYHLTENYTISSETEQFFKEDEGSMITAGTDVAVVSDGNGGFVYDILGVTDSSVVLSITDDQGNEVAPVNGSITLHGSGCVGVLKGGSGVIDITLSKGSSSGSGAVMLSDDVASSCGTDDGVAATPAAVSGVNSGLSKLSGDVSGLLNFSKVTVVNSEGTTVTNGTLIPTSNADDTLKLQAGDNVTLSVAASTKTVKIAATGSVTGAMISGTSSKSSGATFDMSGKVIVIPTAATGGYGVTKLTNTIDATSGTAVTPWAVSGAISGVNSGLATKVGGSNLHSGLVAKSLSNPSSWSGNTIYAMLAALHSVDGESES